MMEHVQAHELSPAVSGELSNEILDLQQGDHLCLFYDRNPAEQLPALVPFIADGLSHDEQFIYVADDHVTDELAGRLEQHGIEVDRETDRGRLKLWTRQQWRQPGTLDSDRKAHQVRQFIHQAAADGFKGIRFAVEMTWTLGPEIGARELEHWEATINTLFEPGFPGRIICQYNRSRLSPEVMLAALHTHPLAILGDEVCPNPFYQAPLILSGYSNGNGTAHGNGKSARARVDWVISQIKRARSAQRQREELIRHKASIAEAELSRKKIEASESRWRGIFEATPDCVKIVGLDGTLLAMNEAGLQIIGAASKEAAIGKSVFALIAPEHRDAFRAMHERVCGGSTESLEFEIERLDGGRRWVSTRATPLRNAETGVAEHLAVTRDITEQRTIEERFRLAAHSDAVTLYEQDSELRYTWLYPLHPEHARSLGKSDPELMPNESGRALARLKREVMTTGQPRRHEVKTDLSVGTRVYDVLILPRRNAAGEIIGVAGTALDITRRKEVQERLREMEERFRSILDNAPAVIFIKDVQGRYLQVNRAFERLVQMAQQELAGKTDFDLFPAEIARKFRDNDLTVIRTGQPLEIEESLPHDDGLRTYISTRFPLRRDNGGIYAITGISTDITERKRNEVAALRLAAIVESSDDAIVGKDLNGIITSWNKGAERIFGYTADEIIGKSVTMLMPPERVNEEPGILERIRRGERIDHYETVRRRKDGKLLDISLTISPVKDTGGRVIGASKVARDITERKRIEREQQALYDLVAAVNQTTALPEICHAALETVQRCLNADRAAVLLYDNDGVLRFKAWRGLSEEYRCGVEGHSPWKPDDPHPQPVCIDNVEESAMEPHLRDVVEWEGIRALAFIPIRYGRRLVGKFMVYYNAPHHFTPEEIRPAETIATQIAFAIDRRRSGEALERLVQQRTASLREAISQMEEFSYSVSHDLRAPVRAMQGYAKAVLDDYGERLDDTGRNYLDRIVRGGGRMDRLIQDILTYSRLSRREIRLYPVALDRLVREILSQYPEMQAAHAEIVIRGKLRAVMGHEASLSQAISNLLNNAIKFVPPGTFPRVQLWTEQNDGQVRLWVEDNGIGIKPEHQHRLFGMFERIHPESKYEGTGIGLAIVRKAVERMGGKVGLESDGLTGSRFWIQLPAAAIA